MKTIKLFFFLFIIFSSTLLQSQTYQILFDKDYSSISGAESLASIFQTGTTIESQIFPIDIGTNIKSKWKKKAINVSFRLGRFYLYDLTVINSFTWVQFFTFGDGYQFRNLNYTDSQYELFLPYPYGKGGGFSSRGQREQGRSIGDHEWIAMRYGRYEATQIFSRTISNKWILSDSIHFKEAMLCVRAFNQFHYAALHLRDLPVDFSFDPNNLQNYLLKINTINGHGRHSINGVLYTSKKLRKRAWINFLNPFVGFAFLTATFDYGWKGKKYGKLRWIKFGNFRYLPSFRLGLTPFGDEIFFENFLKRKKHAIRIYYRYGNPIFEDFSGVGVETYNFWNFKNRFQLDLHFDIWDQPRLNLGRIDEKYFTENGVGGMAKLNFKIKPGDLKSKLFLAGQLGYKTNGYIEGEPLKKGLILRVGIAYEL